ncbi:unnamed protein product [Schistosoma turkestanicum]|nr:unnamed protein product [Schistosoma turkestanicum]
MQDAMDPLPDINFKEMDSIQSYSERLVMHIQYKIFTLGTYINLTTDNIRQLNQSVRKSKQELLDMKDSLNNKHLSTNDKIDQYEQCIMDLQQSFQNIILMEDIVKTIEMEERDFGIRLTNTPERKVCFNALKRDNTITKHLKALEFCLPPSVFFGNDKRKLDEHIENYNIIIRKLNFELFNFELLTELKGELEKKYKKVK